MTDAVPANDGQPTTEQAAVAAQAAVPAAGLSAAPVASSSPVPASLADERPELVVGAAFAGGLAVAFLLKRLAR